MLNQLKLKHDKLVNRAKTLADKDTLDESESKEIDSITEEVPQLRSEIDRLEKIEKMELLATKQENPQDITERSKFDEFKKDFSLQRWLQHLSGMDVDVGHEKEVSEELRRRSGGLGYEGTPVPMSAVIPQQRASTTTTPAGGPGSNLIATELMSGEYINFLRPMLVMGTLGARMLTNLMGNVDIPRQKTGLSASWLTETGAVSQSDLEFEKITMTPKRAAIMSGFSRFMLLQSSPEIQTLIQQDMATAIAQAIDAVAITGGGTNQPTGILGGAGTEYTQSGTITNGKKLAYADLLGLIQAVNVANIGATSRGFLTNYAIANSLKQISRGVATTDMNAIYKDGQIADERSVISNLVPSNLTQGTATNANAVIYGNWSDLLIGYWDALDILVNPYESTAYKAGNILVRAQLVVDVNVRYKTSFQFIDSALA